MSRCIDEHELLGIFTAKSQMTTAVAPNSDRTPASPFDTSLRVSSVLSRTSNKVHLRNVKDILYVLDEFRNKKQEYVVCLSVGSDERLIACRVVTIGTLETSLAHPREVFADPITDRAAYIILAHNHPSGVAEPSKKDLGMTQQLAAVGQILGIGLNDHLVITRNGFFSFKREGLL